MYSIGEMVTVELYGRTNDQLMAEILYYAQHWAEQTLIECPDEYHDEVSKLPLIVRVENIYKMSREYSTYIKGIVPNHKGDVLVLHFRIIGLTYSFDGGHFPVKTNERKTPVRNVFGHIK